MARRGDNIRKRKDGRWEGRFRNGSKENGAPKYTSVYANSFTECKKKLREAQLSHQPIKRVNCREKIFSEILHQWILANRIRLKGATEAKYTNIIETHIAPELGGIRISAIDSSVINAFLEKKLRCGGVKNGKPLSPSYVKTMAVIIEAAIKYAAEEGLCLPLRSPVNKPVIPKKDLSVLSRSAETRLTEALSDDNSRPAAGLLLALQAGLRIGEVCALRWKDIDFENDLIHIRHTIARIPSATDTAKTVLILDSPKTASSFRYIPMPSTLKNTLMSLPQTKCSDFVISGSESFIGTRTFDYQYRQLLKKYGIQSFSFHTLRHTYATRCAEHGIDAKTLSCLLGHSAPNTTLSIYVHPSIETMKRQIEQIYS